MKQRYLLVLSAVLIVALLSSIALALQGQPAESASPTPTYTCQILHTYPHDSAAFTEGLVYVDSFLYESTGHYGSSTLRRVDLEMGNVLQQADLPSQYFGEGIAVVGDRIVQLTYMSHTGFIYNKATFALLGNFTFDTQGWGLTYDGNRLIMSDGSSTLYFLNPETFERTGQVQVHDGNATVSNLNELEYIQGEVYANIYQQQKIAVINPQTGQVTAWVDLSGVSEAAGVSNGIAYDAQNNRLFLTGKNWAHLYEVQLVPD